MKELIDKIKSSIAFKLTFTVLKWFGTITAGAIVAYFLFQPLQDRIKGPEEYEFVKFNIE